MSQPLDYMNLFFPIAGFLAMIVFYMKYMIYEYKYSLPSVLVQILGLMPKMLFMFIYMSMPFVACTWYPIVLLILPVMALGPIALAFIFATSSIIYNFNTDTFVSMSTIFYWFVSWMGLFLVGNYLSWIVFKKIPMMGYIRMEKLNTNQMLPYNKRLYFFVGITGNMRFFYKGFPFFEDDIKTSNVFNQKKYHSIKNNYWWDFLLLKGLQKHPLGWWSLYGKETDSFSYDEESSCIYLHFEIFSELSSGFHEYIHEYHYINYEIKLHESIVMREDRFRTG